MSTEADQIIYLVRDELCANAAAFRWMVQRRWRGSVLTASVTSIRRRGYYKESFGYSNTPIDGLRSAFLLGEARRC